MNIESLYQLYLYHPKISTDTRKIEKGDIFFALKGENFNGNTYAKQALEQGAAFCIVDEKVGNDSRLILVNDVLETLQQLAKFHREKFIIPFVAITGSNGKTTTKELIHSVLSTTYRTYTTVGNLNNHIGIPLTILKIKPDAEMAIIEMGANHQGEISSYCEYAEPTHALITNIGKAHLEGFGGAEGVKKGKGELFKYVAHKGGTLFVNNADEAIKEITWGLKNLVHYGGDSELKAEILPNSDFLQLRILSDEPFEIYTHLVGKYNLHNVLAAICIGQYFEVPREKIKEALEGYIPQNSRSQMMKQGSNIFIMDSYNANPSSMKAAIENFSEMNVSNKVLLIGEMRELGEDSQMEHQAIVDLMLQYPWNNVVLVGELFQNINHPYLHFNSALDAREWFQSQHFENTTFLLKGSRGIKMEEVIQ